MAANLAVEDIRRRCRAAAEQLQALAGSPHDLIASADPRADLFREAASLLLGYDQCLLIESVLTRSPHRTDAQRQSDGGW